MLARSKHFTFGLEFQTSLQVGQLPNTLPSKHPINAHRGSDLCDVPPNSASENGTEMPNYVTGLERPSSQRAHGVELVRQGTVSYFMPIILNDPSHAPISGLIGRIASAAGAAAAAGPWEDRFLCRAFEHFADLIFRAAADSDRIVCLFVCALLFARIRLIASLLGSLISRCSRGRFDLN